jgi:hypothetical protein
VYQSQFLYFLTYVAGGKIIRFPGIELQNECSIHRGMFIYGTQTVQQDVLVINPTKTWNKIYINLTPTISNNTDASKFKVYFKATKEEGAENSEIYLDNIKLLHF